MTKYAWVYDPHSGGSTIPPTIQEETRKRILSHAKKMGLLNRCQLEIRFKSQFCYIDALENSDTTVLRILPLTGTFDNVRCLV